jgi:hypothetical protein
MDVGVAGMMFSGAFVAGPRLRAQSASRDRLSALKNVVKSCKIAVPLIFLGLARIVLTKGVNYHVRDRTLFFFSSHTYPIPRNQRRVN